MGTPIYRIVLAVVVVAAAIASSCGPQSRVQKSATADEPTAVKPAEEHYLRGVAFQVKEASPMMTQEQQQAYYAEHFWDAFDFSDAAFVEQVDNTLMMQTLLASIAYSTTPETTPAYIASLMERTTVSKPVMQYFLEMGEKLFYDPNSLYRNDEYYIPMLDVALSSGLLDEYERMPYESDLHIVSQNRVGQAANDFVLTLSSGKQISLYDIEADYTLMFISNPGCPMCRDVKEQLLASQLLTEMTQSGELKVVVLYPDQDLEAWRAALGDYPAEWINGYDAEMTIESDDLYDLKAIPSFYLLDEDKRVLVKDSVSVPFIEESILY